MVCHKVGCSILGNYEETYRFAGNTADGLDACVDWMYGCTLRGTEGIH